MCHLTLNHLKFLIRFVYLLYLLHFLPKHLIEFPRTLSERIIYLIQTKQVSKKNYTPVVITISFVGEKRTFGSCSVEKYYYTLLHFTVNYLIRRTALRNDLFMFAGARK